MLWLCVETNEMYMHMYVGEQFKIPNIEKINIM